MSYYDPILQELEQLDQPNYLTQSGQAMSMRGAPIQVGGGFWNNLAAQLVPGLLGAGMSYLGQQQDRGAEDALLAAAKLENPQAIAASLEASGYKDTAAKVLFAAQAEQKAAQAAYAAKLQGYEDEYKYSIEPKHKLDMEKYNAQQKKIDSRAGAKNSTMLEAARIAAGAEGEKAIRQAELQFIKEGNQLPAVMLVNKTAPMVQSLDNLASEAEKRGYATGQEAITAYNQAGRASSDEALSETNIRALMASEGFQGEIEQFIGWAANKGRVSPSLIRAMSDAAKKTQAGRELEAENQIKTLAEQYGTITNAPQKFEALKPSFQKMAQAIASELTQGPQPVQMPKPVTEKSLKEVSTVTSPRLLKEGEIGKYRGKIYTRVNGQLMEGNF